MTHFNVCFSAVELGILATMVIRELSMLKYQPQNMSAKQWRWTTDHYRDILKSLTANSDELKQLAHLHLGPGGM